MSLFSWLASLFSGSKPAPTEPAATPVSAPITEAVPSKPASTLPRGIRNNNPGNVDRDGTQWVGMASDQSSDPRFIVFTLPEDGIRALAIILKNYQAVDGLHTIQAMIDRWAPPSENNSTAYVDFVAGRVGLAADTAFDFTDYNFALPMTQAIIAQENADYAYPVATVDAGLQLAGIVKAQMEA